MLVIPNRPTEINQTHPRSAALRHHNPWGGGYFALEQNIVGLQVSVGEAVAMQNFQVSRVDEEPRQESCRHMSNAMWRIWSTGRGRSPPSSKCTRSDGPSSSVTMHRWPFHLNVAKSCNMLPLSAPDGHGEATFCRDLFDLFRPRCRTQSPRPRCTSSQTG